MDNRKYVDTVLVLTGKDLVKDRDKYKGILDSNVLVKKFIETTQKLNIDNENAWEILHYLFWEFEKNELEEAIKLMTNIIVTCSKYVNIRFINRYICQMIERLKYEHGCGYGMTMVQRCKFIDINSITTRDINGKVYDFNIRRDTKYGKYRNIKILRLESKDSYIDDIGAILIKDDKPTIHYIKNRLDEEELYKTVMDFDYDLGIVTDTLKGLKYE